LEVSSWQLGPALFGAVLTQALHRTGGDYLASASAVLTVEACLMLLLVVVTLVQRHRLAPRRLRPADHCCGERDPVFPGAIARHSEGVRADHVIPASRNRRTTAMTDLLETAIKAHGGRDRWQQVKKLTAKAKIGGGLWGAKGKSGILDDTTVIAEAHRQHLEYSPFGEGRHSVYEPDHTAIVGSDGNVLERRDNPRATFQGHVRETQWDNHNLIYFSGYAMWTYLTTPFLFKMPGFIVEEVEPWSEDGEEWRRLKVTFPATVPSHSTVQIFYFDRSGLLRRHDYSADVLGGMPSANYATDPKEFGGLIVPTKRRVFARTSDNRPVRERVAVAIDFKAIEIS
jgi:hypothetical protein